MLFVAALLFAIPASAPLSAQGVQQTKGSFEDKFRQLDEVLPDPNTYRNASGAPGHEYWQQKVDYKITATLDETRRRLTARAAIRYTNNSPDALPWLWLQLDQNIFKRDSMAELTDAFGGPGRRGPKVSLGSASEPTKLSMDELRRQQAMADNDYGYDIREVTLMDGAALPHTIVGTLMRVDLPAPLASGETAEFAIEWAFNIVEEDAVNARSGYEHFPDDPRKGGNDIFLLAQWFPRMVVYSDYEGWHNKEFLGRGEFTLEFGDYEVDLTVPADHIVAATGTIQNPDAVLTAAQRQRLATAKNAAEPMFIVTPQEAAAAESGNPRGTKTWNFSATNVRDFAWASSRKFIWDAQGVKQPGAENETVLAMSFWP
ncbi:MAG: aminopeptidase, partial [Erythrobacteraceae bacterium]